MIAALQKKLAPLASAWAEENSLNLSNLELSVAPAPAHAQADLSVSWPLAAAKAHRKNPMDLAKSLAENFSGFKGIIKAAAAAPGFVNFNLDDDLLWENLRVAVLNPSSYGRNADIIPKKILIEFVSANPTGPLHLASGRSGALGDSLIRILRRLGHDARAEYYVNDAGRQVEKLGQSLLARRKGEPVPEDGYHGDYVTEIAKSFPPEADSWNAEEFSKRGIVALLKTQREDMESFGVSFDRWFRESELHELKALDAAALLLKERGMVYQKDGATWLGTASDSGDDKDRVLIRQNGLPTYFLADIAYHENKYSRGFSELIDILGADHHGYVPRMKAAIAALGHPEDSFHPVVHQLILLFRGKEPVKMSKRAGEFVRLKEVIDEVGKDACRFFFAMRTPNSHLNFDLELAKKRTSENPVYYCQYVHARIHSIFKEAEKQGLKNETTSIFREKRFALEPEERALLLKIAWFPEILKTVERELSPHPLANYVLELAGLFHPFYEKRRVVDPAQAELSRSRIFLCAGIGSVIKEALSLIGVSAPDEM